MKVLLIIAQKNFRDEELFETKEELEKANIKVEVASIATEKATGMLGGAYQPNLAAKDAKAENYDAIVIVGGAGSPELAKHLEVLSLLKTGQQKGKLLAAICLGPTVLAKAGVLKAKKATVWSSPTFQESVDDLKKNGANYVSGKLVQDEKLITAFGPQQAREFGKAIAANLRNQNASS